MARVCRVPCSANRCRSPAPPIVCSAKTISLGVFLWYPSGVSIAVVNLDWACSACACVMHPDAKP